MTKERQEQEEQKDSKEIHQPHDKYFKAVFKKPVVVRDFIQAHIPKEIIKKVDLKSISLTNASFVKDNEDMGALYSDLVFKAKISGRDSYIYFLIEHQRTQDNTMPLRILEYNVELMKQHLEDTETDKLPIILNVCIQNGETKYTGPLNFIDMFEEPELAESWLFRNYYVVDLCSTEDSEILKHKKAALAELVLKLGGLRKFYSWYKQNESVWVSLSENVDIKYLQRSIRYISTRESIHKEKIFKLLSKAGPKNRKAMMTVARQIKEEGIKEGLLKGKREGLLKGKREGIQERNLSIAKSMLLDKEPYEKIMRWTGLSKKEIEKLALELTS